MRKFISIILLITLISLLTACKSQDGMDVSKMEKSKYDSSQQSRDITLSVHESYVSSGTEYLTLIYTNNTGNKYTFGMEPHLEVEAQGEWYVVKTLENAAWDEIAYVMEAKDEFNESFPVVDYYGSLKEGNYRIVKKFYLNDEPIFAIAEFKVNK